MFCLVNRVLFYKTILDIFELNFVINLHIFQRLSQKALYWLINEMIWI